MYLNLTPFIPIVVWVLLALIPPFGGRPGALVPTVHLALSVFMFVVLGAVSKDTLWLVVLGPGAAVSVTRLAVVGRKRARRRPRHRE